MQSFQYLHSCSSVETLIFCYAINLCLRLPLSQKVNVKELHGLLAQIILGELYCRADGTIAWGSVFERDYLAARCHYLSPPYAQSHCYTIRI